ncbi:MAG: Zn-ribbon domain-containing OB-fold protein [Micromonosporaceae bacterium]
MADSDASTVTKRTVYAVDGWFTVESGRAWLLGSRCTSCGTIAFPRDNAFCRNPRCEGEEFERIRLSRRGRIWSYTTSAYPPPPPFPASEPYVPVTIAAVELEAERIVVLGQVTREAAAGGLAVGMEMELTAEPLYEDDESVHLVWKWARAEGQSL